MKVLADMETWGVGVDMEACRKAQQLLNCKLRALEAKAQQLAGMPFSLSIPGEVAHVLYQHLQLPVPAGCKGKQHPSTDKHALDLLRYGEPAFACLRQFCCYLPITNSSRPLGLTLPKNEGIACIVSHENVGLQGSAPNCRSNQRASKTVQAAAWHTWCYSRACAVACFIAFFG